MTLPTMLLIVSFLCAVIFIALVISEAHPNNLIALGISIIVNTVLAISMML